ncbi:MAG: hypothetical protein NWE80_01185 [Candidatus Bathyarchaeota archaeon]|nr:hypothetical protein [Candidatus Bathyarchaeota archaeon]
MNKIKTVAIVSVIACVILSSTLVGVVLNLQASIQETNDKIDVLSQDISEMHKSHEEIRGKIADFEEQYYFP